MSQEAFADLDLFQGLSAEQRRSVLFLAPLLRVSDALDRSRDQRVESVSGRIQSSQIVLTLHSEKDTGLERWAVESAAAGFAQVYGKRLSVSEETA